MNRAFTSEAVAKKSGEFVFVKGTQKLANQFEIKGAPAVVVVDPDSEELFRGSVKNESDVAGALEKSLEKYKNQEISWGAEVAPAPGSRKLLVVGFDKEGFEGLKVLEDRMLAKYHAKCQFVRFPYEKDGATAKKWGIVSAPTLVLADAGSEKPEKEPFAKLAGAKSAASLRMEIKKALLKLEKK